MRPKVKSVLLVEDDPATNLLHQIIIKKAAFAEDVHVVLNGKEALEFIDLAVRGILPIPELILLDINMPIMNGWEFFEAYEQLDEDLRNRIKVIMLTTSMNPDDETRAKRLKSCAGFKSKPLTRESLSQIVNELFEIER